MKRSGFAAGAAGIGLFMSTTAGFCADVAGTVADAQHDPVPGVVVSVKAEGAAVALQAISDSQGAYRITGLSPGLYDLALKSQSASCKGGTSVAYVGQQGLSVDWLCSPKTEAIALARNGAPATQTAAAGQAPPGDPFGLSFPAFLSLLGVGGFITGVTVNGIVASVTSQLPPLPHHPASPSL
jgi:hypothetical protein